MIQTTLGTPYQIETEGKILLVEEVGESAYTIERSLDHLFSAGVFSNVAGVIFGEFSNITHEPMDDAVDANPSINEILVKKFKCANYPVLIGFNFSHDTFNLTFPIGATAKLDGKTRTLELIEKPVR
jgi:muramoyltetrapeptide carboxypeptidase